LVSPGIVASPGMIVSLPNPDGKFLYPGIVSRFFPSFPAAAIKSHGKFLIAS
jgi:hypothetical protein